MSKQGQYAHDSKLLFFGKIIASATHEIKNALAVINENAGLVIDYSTMRSEGVSPDLKRFETLAGRIVDQVKRADKLLKNINLFSHSLDEPLATVELNQILHLLAALSFRIASMQGVTIQVLPSKTPVEATTSPFILIHILFLCIEFAIQAADKGDCIQLEAKKTETGNSVRFGPLSKLEQMPDETWHSVSISEVLPMIKTGVIADKESGNIVLVLSEYRE
ncbi:MAG: hypothetical protein AB1659_01260 [Thermodesulfobacteriota bacterium]